MGHADKSYRLLKPMGWYVKRHRRRLCRLRRLTLCIEETLVYIMNEVQSCSTVIAEALFDF